MDTATSPLNEDGVTTSGVAPGVPEEGESEEATRLRAEIAATRENIGSTIGALQYKLRPAALAEQAKTVVRDATIGKVENMVHDAEHRIASTGYSFLDTIRENPLPAAMAAIGVAWLLMRRRSGGDYGAGQSYRRDYDERWGRNFDRNPGGPSRSFSSDLGDVGRAGDNMVERVGQTIREGAQDAGHALSDKAQDAGHAISETAQHAGQAISETAQQAGHAVSETAQQAGKAVKHYAREVEAGGRRMEARLEHVYRDNPLAFGAVVMAAGTAVGLAIPISRMEDQWLGRARDEVVDKAADLAHETLDKVEGAAKQANQVAGLASELNQKPARAIQAAR